MTDWPKSITTWPVHDQLYTSVPFTWLLPKVKAMAQQITWNYKCLVVGGPALELMPDFLSDCPNVVIGNWSEIGVLQRINPLATRTTMGCIRSCRFCGIGQGRIEVGGLKELDDWPDLPIVCDNNLLASSDRHFDRVLDRLEKHLHPDFNQGLDARLLTSHHSERFSRLHSPFLRLACDSSKNLDGWATAFDTLINGGCKKSWVSTYALIGFDSDPSEAWSRCETIQKSCNCLPMWFHELDCLKYNAITTKQYELGWDMKQRTRIMRRFYKAKYGGYV